MSLLISLSFLVGFRFPAARAGNLAQFMKSSFFIKTFLPVFAAMAIVAGIAYAVWTEPTTNPPGDNVSAPINTGSQDQTKTGGFTAASLKAGVIEGTTVKGTSQLCIGTDCRTAWPSGGSGYTPCECGIYYGWLSPPGSGLCPGWPSGSYPCGTTCVGYGATYTCLNSQWIGN